MNHTKQASQEELEDLFLKRVKRMLKSGTTTVECKSGYGLETETEVKMLKVIKSAQSKTPVELVPTYLAHSVPKGSTAELATKDVVENQIPTIHVSLEGLTTYPRNCKSKANWMSKTLMCSVRQVYSK